MSGGNITHIIEIGVGVDLPEALFELARRREMSIRVLNGRGVIEQVTLRQPTGSIVTHQGSFSILSMAGTIIPSSTVENAGELEVCLSSASYEVIGGSVVSPMVASHPLVLTVVSHPF